MIFSILKLKFDINFTTRIGSHIESHMESRIDLELIFNLIDIDVNYFINHINEIPNETKWKIKMIVINRYFYRLYTNTKTMKELNYSHQIDLDIISILNYYTKEAKVVKEKEINDIIRDVLFDANIFNMS